MRSLATLYRSAATETTVRPEGPTSAQFIIHSDNASLEGFADQIIQRLPEGQVQKLPSFQVALESQQLDDDRQKDLEAQYQDLVDSLNPQPTASGEVQVFLLDETGSASGHAGSQAALKALVRASMKDSGRVVAALTSSWKQADAVQNPDEITVVLSSHALKAHRALIKNYLNGAGIPSFETLDALVDHLNTL